MTTGMQQTRKKVRTGSLTICLGSGVWGTHILLLNSHIASYDDRTDHAEGTFFINVTVCKIRNLSLTPLMLVV